MNAKKGKQYRNVRNGNIATVKGEDSLQVILDQKGTEIYYSHATFKRWWKPVDEGVEQIDQQDNQEQVLKPVEEVKEIKKPISKVEGKKLGEISPIVDMMYNIAKDYGCTVKEQGTNHKNFSMSFNGKNILTYYIKKDGIAICVKKEIAAQLELLYNIIKHTFPARIDINADNACMQQVLVSIVNACVNNLKDEKGGK